MILKLATAPAEEPITLAEAKTHLRVDHNDENDLITRLLRAARLSCEKIARRAFVTQTWDLYLHTWPAGNRIELPLPPLQSVTSVSYITASDETLTMVAGDYFVDNVSEPGGVLCKAGVSWPSAALRPAAAIAVRFVAGYGLAVAVPDDYKAALLLALGAMYERRGDDVPDEAIPGAAVNLLTMDRGGY